MSQSSATNPPPLPGWLCLLASVLVLGHLSAILLAALAATSGPWAGPQGQTMSTPPQFAYSTYHSGFGDYLKFVKLTSDYHFRTNRANGFGARLEVRLKDADKRPIGVLQFPDPAANRWVRHRQALLASWLTEDEPVVTPPGEVIPAPNQPVPLVPAWRMVEPGQLVLLEVPQHLVPRDQMVLRPSELALLLTKSYARHLCRRQGAAFVEIIRHSEQTIPPSVLFERTSPPPGPYNPLASSFGDMPR